MSEPIIHVDHLHKRFGAFKAVDGISFDIGQGELFGFLGPNGAGKTTTISMLTTQLRPSGGRARIAGFDVNHSPDEVRKRIGVIFQDPSLDLELTAYENLWFHGVLYGVTRAVLVKEIPAMIEMVDLSAFMRKPVKTFSGGMKRRLEIARGLLHSPQVLFLDEPTLGLDTQTRQHIWDHIDSLRRQLGMTVFLTTHYLEETERCDTIAIMDHGKIVDQGKPAALKQKHNKQTIEQLFLALTGRSTRDELIAEVDAAHEEYRLMQRD